MNRRRRPRAVLRAFLRKRRRALAVGFCAGLAVLFVWLAVLWPQTALTSPPATPLYVDRHGSYLCEDEADLLGFWDVTDDGGRVAQALIAVEDKRFNSHGGVDLHALARALVNNLQGGARQGASTLAMQVARLQGPPGDRGYGRKLEELVIARLMTWRHGREAVLRHYLKLVPQGNRMHGVVYAARRYFHKPPQDLTWAEAAVLAALPKAPGRMNLYRTSGRDAAFDRARLVLDRLYDMGTLDAQSRDRARDQLAHLTLPQREVRPFNAYHAVLRLDGLPRRATYSGPMRSTLDLELQTRVEAMAYAAVQDFRRQGAGNIAVVLADRAHGDILAYVGSAFYGDARHAGSIDYAATPRSAGSTLKPFIYALGMEDGLYTPASVLDDLPLHLTYEGGHYTALNYDRGYLGPMLYGHALANSRNIPALSVLRHVGLQRAHGRLRELGLGDPELPAAHYGLGLAIGGMYVTLEDLVGAYGTLACDGMGYRTRWLLDDPGGPTDVRRFPEHVARRVTGFLSDPTARLPGFPQLEFPFPVAVKTGTSQGYRDAWSVAYSSDYLLGIWVGRPDSAPMKELGGLAVARLAVDMMTVLQPQQARGIGETPFPAAHGAVLTRVCALTGEEAGPYCEEAVEVALLPEELPHRVSSAHQVFAVDRRSGAAATDEAAPEDVVLRAHTVLPPRYAAWSRGKGFQPPPGETGVPRRATLAVRAPSDGARFRLDPAIPARFQTLALTAEVTPAVPEVAWYVDGRMLARVPYPYTTRWQLAPGTHRIEARFPNAAVTAEPVTVQVE